MSSTLIVLTDEFETQWRLLLSAAKQEAEAAVTMQIHASWIIHRGLWQQAEDVYFYDVASGMRFRQIEDIPEGITCRRTRTRRWVSQEDFLNYLDQAGGYSKATFWTRHRQIMRELALWATANRTEDIPELVFRDTVEAVLKKGRVVGELVCKTVFDFEPRKRYQLTKIQAVNPDAAARLPGVAEIFEDIPEGEELDQEEIKVVVAQKALDYIQETRDAAAGEGHRAIRQATQSVRQRITKLPTISVLRNGPDLRMYVEYPQEEQGEWEVKMPQMFILLFVDINGETFPFIDLPVELRDWLYRQMRVRSGQE